MHRSAVAAAALLALAPAAAFTMITTAGGAASAGLATSAGEHAPSWSVTARIHSSDVVADEGTVRITGSVKPRAVGRTVVLQQRFDGTTKWKKSGKTTVRPSGRFVLRDEPSVPGVRFYRVLKPASDGLKAGTSRELELAVWSWERLAYRPLGAHDGVYFGDVAFGTDVYTASIYSAPGLRGYVEYTLGGKCRALRGTYALTDTSASGATGSVGITVDGKAAWGTSLVTGTIVRDSLIDVTGAFRVRFDLASTASPVGYAALGTPEVLCLD